jgi:hypothetical protein
MRPMSYFTCWFGFFLIMGSVSAQTYWNRSYGNGYNDRGTAVVVTPDGSIVAVGQSTQEETRIQWLKTDSLGDFVARKFFGGPGITWANHAALFPADSGVVVCGSRFVNEIKQYDQYVARLNSAGDTLWTQSFGDIDWDVAQWIGVDSSDTIHVVGQGFSATTGLGQVIWTVFSPNGQMLTQKTLSHPGSNLRPVHAIPLPEGGWLIGGELQPGPAGGQDLWAAKLDAQLDTLWTRSYGSAGDDRMGNVSLYRNAVNAITYTLGGDFSLPGQNQGFIFMQRIATNGDSILRVDAAQGGGLLFSRKNCKHLYKSTDGAYTIMCQVNSPDESQFWNVEFSQTSFLFWQSGQVLFVGSQYKAEGFSAWPSGGFIVTGETDVYGPGVRALFLSKVGPLGEASTSVVVGQEEWNAPHFLPFPNPTQSVVYLHADAQDAWQTFDVSGRMVQPVYEKVGEGWQIDFTGLPMGWYRVCGRKDSGETFTFGVLYQRD